MCVFKGFAGDFCGVSTHLAGRFDFLKSPKSNPSLKEGLLDFSKKSKVHPPPPGGSVGLSEKSKVHVGGYQVQGGGGYKVTLV